MKSLDYDRCVRPCLKMPRRTSWLSAAAVVVILLPGFGVCETLAAQSGDGFSVGVIIRGKGKKPKGHNIGESRSSYTWNAAGISVSRARFTQVIKAHLSAGSYWFTAHRQGQWYTVAVSRHSGRILRVTRLPRAA
jgi:hypothetical protein